MNPQMTDYSARLFGLSFLVATLSTLMCPGVQAASAVDSIKTCPAPDALLKLANDGDRSAQFVMGKRLLSGPQAEGKAGVDWLQRAADQGSVSAQVMLGTMYLEGKNVSKNPAISGKWFLRAAEQGNAEAQHRLEELYTDGIGVPKDRMEASYWRFQYLSNAERVRISLAAAVSPVSIMAGRASIAEYVSYAEQGSSLAQYTLGRRYIDAPYGERDEKLGTDWLRKAAEQGHSRAMADLATILAVGASGVEVDEAQAVELFRAVAKQNVSVTKAAMLDTSSKVGGRLDAAAREEKAFFWMAQIADLGYSEGQYRLGRMFENGTGVAQDYAQAASSYERAANQGNPQSQYDLARMYLGVNGVPLDVNRAYFWWALSVKGGRLGGALATEGYWDERSVSNKAKIDEEVRQWKRMAPETSSETSLQLEQLCAQAN